ncbi:MAG: 1-acyl-sn-glycerol-3-phosphate acyltransferase [Candidatus Cloacimonetes bacterium]|nr:1-acyl-sn-glycerol-3-phosphate acyltransferase [Candidatus Cloacimonadota bacterium]
MKIFYKIVKYIIYLEMKYIWNLKIIHPEHLENPESCIIAPNHISLLDPPFIGSLLRNEIYILAKKELFEIPITGYTIKRMYAIPIRRGQIDRNATMLSQKALQEGYPLMMFPEGTRKSSSAKPGIGKMAYETRSNIIPVFIQYPASLLKALFRKDSLKIVIGEKIIIDEFEEFENRKDAYRFIAKYTLERILELENEC